MIIKIKEMRSEEREQVNRGKRKKMKRGGSVRRNELK